MHPFGVTLGHEGALSSCWCRCWGGWLCLNRFDVVCPWHAGPVYSFLCLNSKQKVLEVLSCCCYEILVFSSQRDYPLGSHANPSPIVRVMLIPWNNSVAERLWITLAVFCQAAPHCHGISSVSSVRSVYGPELLRCGFCERVGEDMCNVCERMSCWVRASLVCASSLPLPPRYILPFSG